VLTFQQSFVTQGCTPVWAAHDSTGNFLYVVDQYAPNTACLSNGQPEAPVAGKPRLPCNGEITVFSVRLRYGTAIAGAEPADQGSRDRAAADLLPCRCAAEDDGALGRVRVHAEFGCESDGVPLHCRQQWAVIADDELSDQLRCSAGDNRSLRVARRSISPMRVR